MNKIISLQYQYLLSTISHELKGVIEPDLFCFVLGIHNKHQSKNYTKLHTG